MSRADDLRRQADLLERHDEIAAAHEAALQAYRDNPSEETKAAYRAAVDALQEWRAADRADRDGLTVAGDVVRTDTVEG